jgi:hypothetical protein
MLLLMSVPSLEKIPMAVPVSSVRDRRCCCNASVLRGTSALRAFRADDDLFPDDEPDR